MYNIILASSSPRRCELLKQIGLDFKIIIPDIDETIDELKSAETTVQDLACKKAVNVLDQLRRSIDMKTESNVIIGADTIVVKDGILGKPQNKDDAFFMLKKLQGGWHEVITGYTVIKYSLEYDSENIKSYKGYELTKVKMIDLDDKEIWSYIDTGEPMDKAGAYGIQGRGAVLVERIEGCYFNVVGLPLAKISKLL